MGLSLLFVLLTLALSSLLHLMSSSNLGESLRVDAGTRQPSRNSRTTNSMKMNALAAVLRPLFLVIALVSVWWGASAWNSIAAKQVVLQDPSAVPLMAIMSNVPGGVACCFLWLYDRTILHQSMRQMIPLATMHAIGLYASYMGLVGAKVSLVQAVKAIEPLLAMTLSVFFLRQVPSFWSVLAAGAVVFGVMLICVTDTAYTWTALSWVLISSISTQIRNQLMKRMQKELQTKVLSPSAVVWYSSPERTGLLMFVITSAYALPANGIIALASLSQFQFDPSLSTDQTTIPPLLVKALSGPLLLAGTMHFMYNMASFGVLSLTTPATHSLANTRIVDPGYEFGYGHSFFGIYVLRLLADSEKEVFAAAG
jgi:drug/metabolite transporter (DMT)-like permease